MGEFLLSIFKVSIVELIYLTGVILVAGFVLGVMERASNYFMQRAFGRKGIMITAWLGTPIHEIGHALMCIIFSHKINEVKLLNAKGDSEVLGYVRHSYNPNSLYQRIGNLFIGVGPIFSGTVSLIASLYLLLPNSFKLYKSYLIQGINSDKIDKVWAISVLNQGAALVRNIFTSSNLASINFWIFILIAICISSHIALSRADIKGAQDGFLILFILIIIINLIMGYFSINTSSYIMRLGRYNAHLIGFLIIAIIFSAFTLVISLLCYGITRFKK